VEDAPPDPIVGTGCLEELTTK